MNVALNQWMVTCRLNSHLRPRKVKTLAQVELILISKMNDGRLTQNTLEKAEFVKANSTSINDR